MPFGAVNSTGSIDTDFNKTQQFIYNSEQKSHNGTGILNAIDQK